LGEKAVKGEEVGAPGGRGEGGEALELGVAPGAVGEGVVGDGGEPVGAVEGLEVVWNEAGELAEDGEVAGDDGDGVRKGFGYGEAEAFGEGGEEEGLGVVEKGGHVPVGTGVHFVDEADEGGAAFEEVDAVFAFPAALAEENEVGGAGVACFEGELAPELQEEGVVFARLDGADHHEVGSLNGALRIGGGEGVGGEECGNGRGEGEAVFVGEILEAEEGLGGVGDDAGGKGERLEHAPRVHGVLFRAAVFRVGDGDEVVDEADQTNAAAAERAEIGGAVEVGVAEVEEEGVLQVLREPGRGAPAQDEGEDAQAGVFRRVEDEVEQASGDWLGKDPETVLEVDGGACRVAVVADVGETDAVDTGVQPALEGAVEQAGDVEEEIGHGSRGRLELGTRGASVVWLPTGC
jgi:hypothetical protein